MAKKTKNAKTSKKEPAKMEEIFLGNMVVDEVEVEEDEKREEEEKEKEGVREKGKEKDWKERKEELIQEKKKVIEKKKPVEKEVILKEKNVDKRDFSKSCKKRKPISLFFLILLVLIGGITYFISSLFHSVSLGDVLNGLLILGISILFIVVCLTNPSKKRTTSYLSLGLVFVYQVLGCLVSFGVITWPVNTIGNFVGKSMTDAVEWAVSNKIPLNQEYEYSDMIPEYHVINQNVASGTKIDEIKSLTIAVSEGPSPYKEIVIPNMIGWDTERVLEFIQKNYLINVSVDFVKANENENTLIEQSVSGNIQRNQELKFVFSFGEERQYSEVKLLDLANKSKFEAEFYLKQYGIPYEIDYDFSDKVKRGNVISQSIKAGNMVTIVDNVSPITVTISKGPKITVPDFKSMSVTEITNWVIENKLKIEFKDRYDDTAKENSVVEANYNKGDVVEEGALITITLSKGKLTMPKFASYSEFIEWANTYGIQYEEQHEFSDDVNAGEVIKYSYEVGKAIKNNDVVIVTISDGKKVKVPNVVGLTKKEATNKLNDAGCGYSFVYKYSNTVAEGKVISQSISSGSEVSKGTTVTVTLSNGAKPDNNTGSGNSDKPDDTTTPSTPSTPEEPSTPVCEPQTYSVGRDLNNIFANYSGFDTVASQLYSFFAANYPDVKISVVAVDGGDATSGSYIGGIGPGSEVTSCNSSAYIIQLAK